MKMAIDAKMNFMGQIERKCSDQLTVSDMTKVMRIISDTLEDFDMREISNWGTDEPDDLLNAFEASMKVQGRSPKTIERYKFIIGKFMKYVGVPTRRVNVYQIRSWLTAEKERGIADSTLEGNRKVLSSYFGWLFRESLIEKNPIVNVGSIKVAKKQKRIFSEIDIEKMLHCCKCMRDNVLIHFLRSTGCRISEVTELNRDAIEIGSLECVVHGKGDKERVVYMDSVTGMLLNQYLSNRKDKCEALFVNRYGQRIQPGGIRTMLKEIEQKSGVDHVHPHKFRRTLATELTRRGMPIQEVANILGHEKLDTTMRYVVLNKEDVKSSYRKYA